MRLAADRLVRSNVVSRVGLGRQEHGALLRPTLGFARATGHVLANALGVNHSCDLLPGSQDNVAILDPRMVALEVNGAGARNV